MLLEDIVAAGGVGREDAVTARWSDHDRLDGRLRGLTVFGHRHVEATWSEPNDHAQEAALAEVLGPEAALSKSTVPRICQRIRTEFDAWKTRDLSGVCLDYLFLDGSRFKMHPGVRAEPVLTAWGIDTDGRPVFEAPSSTPAREKEDLPTGRPHCP